MSCPLFESFVQDRVVLEYDLWDPIFIGICWFHIQSPIFIFIYFCNKKKFLAARADFTVPEVKLGPRARQFAPIEMYCWWPKNDATARWFNFCLLHGVDFQVTWFGDEVVNRYFYRNILARFGLDWKITHSAFLEVDSWSLCTSESIPRTTSRDGVQSSGGNFSAVTEADLSSISIILSSPSFFKAKKESGCWSNHASVQKLWFCHVRVSINKDPSFSELWIA